MSGHSKWNNIKRKKEATDSAKAKIFTKIGREIAVCVKEGGGDVNSNSKLRDLVSKAKAANVPNDNIERIIKKAVGDSDKTSYESNVYEGYGPSGIAVIVETLTDNKNRTAGDIRHYFDKFGGNLGTTGCVSFMFTTKGIIVLENNGIDEDKLMDDIMELGGSDFTMDEETAEIETEPNDLHNVREGLEAKGYKVISADIDRIPSTYTSLTDEEAIKKMNNLLDALEDNDDVQNVYHNWDMPEEPDED
ncbi:MAG: YebC/PmpR family DNA-binding transcriptional regulator [Oscillospiraceae bacterium]|nr:YebC/PmpR family DNA-binding transcriptional regulator [Oscillospiraceae bacterium]MBQ4312400.1 YebC/PmpR family DNA-binding transcriptional regulator [Oscillospiraceae bacterium]MCR5167185.1 YebC/PmpR family DNA-binding transcriptional regulator [Oscillospiraceae bacterium]